MTAAESALSRRMGRPFDPQAAAILPRLPGALLSPARLGRAARHRRALARRAARLAKEA